jgi:VIT family
MPHARPREAAAMTDAADTSSSPATAVRHFLRRHVDPTDRLGEALFGIIMVLTFTLGADLVVQEGHDATREMLIAILGCNLAWGVIDGGMYLVGCVFERSLKLRLFESIKRSEREQDARALVAGELDARLGAFTTAAEREKLYDALIGRLKSASLEPARLTKQDLLAALGILWLVTVTALPAILPFLVIHDRALALRVSNGLLLLLLFAVGFRCARVTHKNPWLFGAILVSFGLAMVGIAIALGG